MGGARACDLLGADAKQVNPPEDFREFAFNAMCLLRGVYVMRSSAGLMMDVVSMQYDESSLGKKVECPFTSA